MQDTLPQLDPPKLPLKPKLNRRAALAILVGTVAFAATPVSTSAQSEVNIDLDSIRGFRISYKGKEHAFTTQEVYDALLGEGSFG